MQILYVITQGHYGGAQKYVLDLIKGFTHQHDISVAIGEEEAEYFSQTLKKEAPHVKLYPLKHLKRNISPKHDILAVFELRKLYKTLRPQIVHLNSSKAGVIGSFARTKDTKIIYTAHGWVFLEPLHPLVRYAYRLLEQTSAFFKDAVVVLSPQESDIARIKLHIPKHKLQIIPLGIETIPFFDKKKSRQTLAEYSRYINPHLFWFGTIANHYKTKALDVFIKAVAQLPLEIRSQIQCIVIGDGPERRNLETLLLKHQLEKTFFLLPFIENAPLYLKAFDRFVLPSRKEGLPYTLLEARFAQIPFLATQIGGVPTLQGKQDLIIPSENVDELTLALQTFFEKKIPPITEEFPYSIETMLKSTEALYTKLTS